jgi:hypothetical protein
MNDTVYVVTKNGHKGSYGAAIYLIGVYDNLADAEAQGGLVTKVEKNKTYKLRRDGSGYEHNLNYLGGYTE